MSALNARSTMRANRTPVNHLKEMYPAALAAVTRNAEVSLANHVRNAINHHMRPLLELLIEQSRKGKARLKS